MAHFFIKFDIIFVQLVRKYESYQGKELFPKTSGIKLRNSRGVIVLMNMRSAYASSGKEEWCCLTTRSVQFKIRQKRINHRYQYTHKKKYATCVHWHAFQFIRLIEPWEIQFNSAIVDHVPNKHRLLCV